MKIVRFKDLDFVPASHEDIQDPGAFKKVLLKDILPAGKIQMINWAKIPIGKAFAPHYHQSMIEVFIIINGKIKAKIDNEEEILEKGDLVIAYEGQVHTFENIGSTDVDYFALGLAIKPGGKTITLK